MTQGEQNELERLIDAEGVASVLDALSGLCGLKAEHVRTSWQDEAQAAWWESAERAINTAIARVQSCSL